MGYRRKTGWERTLMRGLMFWRRTNLSFCANYVAQPMMVLLIQAFFLSGHAFVAGSQQLARVLLPCAKRTFFVFVCKLLIFHNFSRRLEVFFRFLNSGGLPSHTSL